MARSAISLHRSNIPALEGIADMAVPAAGSVSGTERDLAALVLRPIPECGRLSDEPTPAKGRRQGRAAPRPRRR